MNIIQKASLFFKDGSSDKEYNTQLIETIGGYVVNFQYGRRGSTLTTGTKTLTPVPLEAATKIYTKLVTEKVGKGYKPGNDSGSGNFTTVTTSTKDIVFVPQLLNPIDESEIESYLLDDSYGAQEKMDGRHQAFSKTAGQVQVSNKKGQVIGHPEALNKAIRVSKDLLIDSEAIGEVFYAFDLLKANGEDLRGLGYGDRYKVLTSIIKDLDQSTIKLVPLAIGYKEKKALYDKLKAAKKEGIVFKKLNAPHKPGRPASGGDMLKAKFYSTVSARVTKGRENKRSVGLELLSAPKGNWVFMGNCTIPPNKEIPKIGSIVEIKMLYCIKGGSFYQPTYLGLRDDVDVEECLMSQVKYKPEDN